MTLIEAARDLLTVWDKSACITPLGFEDIVEDLRTALAASKQAEPVGYMPAGGLEHLRSGVGPMGVWPQSSQCSYPESLYAAPAAPTQTPLTDEQMTAAVLADRTLRHYFALNGGAGPVSEKGIKVFRAVEIAIRGTP